MYVFDALLLFAPLIVFALVAVFGFVGCTKDFDALLRGGEETGTTTFDPEFTPYREEVLSDNPLCYWRLIDADRTLPAVDDIGSPPPYGGHPGAYNYSADNLLLEQSGLNHSEPTKGSAAFDGGYVSVDVAGKPELAPQDFSIELLVVPEWDHGSGDPFARRVVVASHDPVTGTGWALYAADDDQWQGEVWDGLQHSVTPKAQLYFDGNTHHLALTYDDQSGELKLFVDTTPYSAAGTFSPNTTQPLCIGAQTAEVPAPFPFKGRVQEVALYNVVLPPGRITDHYNANAAPL